ncbi:purine-nucleoside phosphorylase [Smaragdicoccus niigatensis]|uniref:purine-nucleoside phosphorylase n=1 Tax=Smaragdicoccus niigatensis TaxID=359359 RepID=UPI00037F386C|nr:purine nucleoside permease [Smaragdicoccus niigatensis]
MTSFSRKVAIALGIGAFAVAGCTVGPAGRSDTIDVGVLVITMFEAENQVWRTYEQLPDIVDVPGVPQAVRCNSHKLCVAETGQGKVNAATTMMAILGSGRFDFSHAYFLTAGIAGTPPDRGTVGGAALARWIVDFDLGNHLVPADAPSVPYGFRPVEDYRTDAYKLDSALVDKAFGWAQNVKLADSPEAVAERANYPGQAGRIPEVVQCDTMTGDDFFSGKQLSDTAAYIMNVRTQGAGIYCTTQMEDNATAGALAAHGYLKRYLSLRTMSNFDQPYPGQSVLAHLDEASGGFPVALQNQYTVGKALVEQLLKNPPAT